MAWLNGFRWFGRKALVHDENEVAEERPIEAADGTVTPQGLTPWFEPERTETLRDSQADEDEVKLHLDADPQQVGLALPRLHTATWSETRVEQMSQMVEGDDLRDHLGLRRIRARPSPGPETVEAIREAYVDWRDDWIVNLPKWLEEIELRLTALRAGRALDETVATRVALLREALTRMTLETRLDQATAVALKTRLSLALNDVRGSGPEQAQEEGLATLGVALAVYTRERFPLEYATIQNTLGIVYQQRLTGEKRANQEQAIACFQAALEVRTCEQMPIQHRDTQLNLAKLAEELGDWDVVHTALDGALAVDDLATALGEGSAGYADAVLQGGGNASIRDAYALLRLGRTGEAARAIERGRARGLAATRALEAADPELIHDATRRARYTQAREALIAALNTLNKPVRLQTEPALLPEEDTARTNMLMRERQHLVSQQLEACERAKKRFNAVVAEIRHARDPDGFLETTVNADAILRAAQEQGAGHALVYLAATRRGGIAVAALAGPPDGGTGSSAPRFSALELPELTDAQLNDLIQRVLPDQENDQAPVIGGYGHAQVGNGFRLILQNWPGETFRERAQALRTACLAAGVSGMLADAAQLALLDPHVATLADRPFSALFRSPGELQLLDATVGRLFLRLELRRCLPTLSNMALRPLAAWLREQRVTGVTLIPCDFLGAFPLAAAVVAPGRTFGDTETFPCGVSVAPSARALLQEIRDTAAPTKYEHLEEHQQRQRRSGVYAVGDPLPTHQPLQWGAAEALTLAKLARRLGLPAETKLGQKATRGWTLQALTKKALVFDASCHGAFDSRTPLESALLLAGKDEGTGEPERLALRDLLASPGLLRGLRLLILSACETAILDLRGARDEVRSLAAATLEAGAEATLASLWAVDDRATYLLMVRFAQEWLPNMDHEAPAMALARAQRWLRTVTNDALRMWEGTGFPKPTEEEQREAGGKPKSEPPEGGAAQAEAASASATGDGAVKSERLAVRGKCDYIALEEDLETLEALEALANERVRGERGERTARYDADEAAYLIRMRAGREDPQAQPYGDPIYWAGFQVTGW